QPEQPESANGGQWKREHNRERMDQAFKLGGQGHVNDDRGQTEDPPDFGGGIAQVARVATPGVEHSGGQFARQHRFDFIDDGADGNGAGRGADAGAAEPAVMVDRIGRVALRGGDHAAQLNQSALVVAHKNPVDILWRQARLPLQLGHHVVFLPPHLDAAEIESAEEDLHRARDVFDTHAQCGSAAAIDVDPQFGLVHLEGHIDVAKIVHPANLVRDVLRDAVERVQVLVLKDQLERGVAEADLDRLGQVGQGDRPFHLAEETLLHTARAEHNLLDGALALALVFEADKNHAEVRLAGPVETGRHNRPVGLHFRDGGDDIFGLAQLPVGKFAGRTVWRQHNAEHAAHVLLREEI